MSVENNLKVIKDFINHNLNCKHITEATTIKELMKYINNIENNYLPLMKGLEQVIKIEKDLR